MSEPQPPGTLESYPGLYRDRFTYYLGKKHPNLKAILLKITETPIEYSRQDIVYYVIARLLDFVL
jgi:hypothetical protein